MKVSVIVCTRNRAPLIHTCLDSMALAIRTAGDIDAEIVVVDNGSEDNTAAVVNEWFKHCGIPHVFLSEPQKGVSKARNCALRHANGDLLIFTDDDCCLSADHIIDALRHDNGDKKPVLRGGRIELGDSSDLPLTIKTDDDVQRWDIAENTARHTILRGEISGCNMTMRREIADKIGFFDERLGPGTNIPGSEDTDFVFRAYLAGFPVEYVPDMIVHHFHGRKDPKEAHKLLSNYCTGGGAMYTKYLFIHPNFCRQFYWDFRKLIKEFRSGENKCMPDFGFSHKDVIFSNLKGSTLFLGSFLMPRG